MVKAIDTVNEAQALMRVIATPLSWYETKETGLARAARWCELTYRQARRIADADISRIDAHVLETLREVRKTLLERAQRMDAEDQKISIALQRELKGRLDAADADTLGDLFEASGNPLRKEGNSSV